MSSEGRVGTERRGELLKRWAESVVRQLNTIKGRVKMIIQGQCEFTWILSLYEIATGRALDNGIEMWKILLYCLLT